MNIDEVNVVDLLNACMDVIYDMIQGGKADADEVKNKLNEYYNFYEMRRIAERKKDA